jgi:hypothetical protein
VNDFPSALAEQARLEHEVVAAEDYLRPFPKLPNGLTPDHVRALPEWRAGKARLDKAFRALQKYNSTFTKHFTKELRAMRDERRRVIALRNVP